MNEDLFIPIELVKPLEIMSDVGCVDGIVISCCDPGFLCKVGQADPPGEP